VRDYTVELPIDQRAFELWLTAYKSDQPANGESVGLALTKYIQERIEEGLTAISPEEAFDLNLEGPPSLIKPDSAGLSDDLRDNKVAFCNLTCANSSLISRLRTRGFSIAGRKFGKLPELEGKILTKDVNFR
jgi:hypothetical protein